VRAAIEMGVDCLLGGVHWTMSCRCCGTCVRYYPFPGGSAAIRASWRARSGDRRQRACAGGRPGVSGLDLLAYRSLIDAGALIRAVCAVVQAVIVAGSIEGPEQIDVVRAGAAPDSPSAPPPSKDASRPGRVCQPARPHFGGLLARLP